MFRIAFGSVYSQASHRRANHFFSAGLVRKRVGNPTNSILTDPFHHHIHLDLLAGDGFNVSFSPGPSFIATTVQMPGGALMV